MFYWGEWGFMPDGENANRTLAEEGAIEHSIGMGETPVCLWNEHDEVLAVVIEGEIFDKRTS